MIVWTGMSPMEECGTKAVLARLLKTVTWTFHHQNPCHIGQRTVHMSPLVKIPSNWNQTWWMKPFPQQNLDIQTWICNYHFSRARVVENVFGILANRWWVFGSPICLKPNKIKLVTVAAVTLHNWLIRGVLQSCLYSTCSSWPFWFHWWNSTWLMERGC